MSQGNRYPVRETGIVAVPGESGLRLRRRDESTEVILNATAVLIWHACDGQRTIDEIAWQRAQVPDAGVSNRPALQTAAVGGP